MKKNITVRLAATYERHHEQLALLQEGESLVSLYQPEKCNGYFLQIGDDVVKHSWAVTLEEMEGLYELLKGELKRNSK